MKALRALVLTASLVAFAVPAGAQVKAKVQLTGAGSTVYGGVYIGPYSGTVSSLAPGKTLDLFCIDFLNGVRIGDMWEAWVTPVAAVPTDPNYTRFGGLADASARYKQAALLASKFRVLDAKIMDLDLRRLEYASLHTAIWHLFTPNVPNWSVPGAQTSVDDWLKYASNNFDKPGINYNYWHVVSDVSTEYPQGGKQEYLTYVTPEPATIFLMGTGLVAVLGMTFVTRRSLG